MVGLYVFDLMIIVKLLYSIVEVEKEKKEHTFFSYISGLAQGD